MKCVIQELKPSTSRKWVHFLYAAGYFFVAASGVCTVSLSDKAACMALLLPLGLGVFNVCIAGFWRRSEIAFVIAREEETPSEFELRIKLAKYGVEDSRTRIVKTISPGFSRFPLELYSAIRAPHVITAYLLWIVAEINALYHTWLFAVRGAEHSHILFLVLFSNVSFFLFVNFLQVRASMMQGFRAVGR
jgi:hypothetical protein